MDIKQFSIQQILDAVSKGEIRIPAFQRGFVWDADRVAYLMDSIYKKYPFGTLLLWRTSERLNHDRKLGPLILPELQAAYPVEYVLDGQQRLTSIFCVFKHGLPKAEDFNWKDIYFDLTATPDPKEQQFLALTTEEYKPEKHFPLKSLFDSAEYRKLLNQYNESQKDAVDSMFRIFQQVQIPCHVHQTDDKAVVAIIFERINRQGIPLDTLQLLSAWTWSEDFQLQEKFKDLTEELHDFGIGADEDEENLLLRCCAAITIGDASPESLLTLSGEEVRDSFPMLSYGMKGAIDFLSSNLNINNIKELPFQTIIVPLSVYFSSTSDSEIIISDEHRQIITTWFWKVCFTKRYSSGVLRNLKIDIDEIKNLKNNQKSILGNFNSSIENKYFTENRFLMGTVVTKTYILLLSQLKPRSFLSGQLLDFKNKHRLSNRTEFHHIFPKAYLATKQNLKNNENCLANFVFLSRSDNRVIGGQAPSIYYDLIPKTKRKSILKSSFIDERLFSTNKFDLFIYARTENLVRASKKLMRIN